MTSHSSVAHGKLADAITIFLDARLGIVSPKTLRINAQSLATLTAYLGDDFPICALTLDQLRGWRAHLLRRDTLYGGASIRPPTRGSLSLWTVHLHLRIAKQFCRWLHLEGKLATNPAAKLEFVQLPEEPSKGITSAEFERLLNVARSTSSLRDEALLLFLYDTGCRLSGAANLTLTRLELERGRAIVSEKGKGGNHKARAVFLKPETVHVLCEYLHLRRAWLEQGACWQAKHLQLTQKKRVRQNPVKLVSLTEENVFLSERLPHAPMTPGGIYVVCKRIGDAANVQRDNPHAFRHGLIIRMLKNGAPLAQVSQIAGHSSIVVTKKHYGFFADHELKEAHTRYA